MMPVELLYLRQSSPAAADEIAGKVGPSRASRTSSEVESDGQPHFFLELSLRIFFLFPFAM
jgi:hypothetical protein